MVGASMALGAAQLGYRVALLEKHLPGAFDATATPELQVSAINAGSIALLEALGVWENVLAMRSCRVNRLSVWEHSQARTDFTAEQLGAPYLAYMVENRLLQLAMFEQIETQPLITLFTPQQELRFAQLTQQPQVICDQQPISSQLLIGADGVHSRVRQAAGIVVRGWQYSQQAMGITLKAQHQQDITWQQFTPNGPLAYLPLYDGHGCLIWYQQAPFLAQLASLSPQQLKTQILQHFPAELAQIGEFEVINSGQFPLLRQDAKRYVAGKTVLVGDAAHSINPLAGQGVNLGFKDVQLLLQQFKTAKEQQLPITQPALLDQYQRQRQWQNRLMMSLMDALYLGFSNDIGPLKLLRNTGLALADRAGPLKKQAMKMAMGLH